jgi:pyruvate dehydrogenase E2 component (dihydrolipoamide acetyltransferase)
VVELSRTRATIARRMAQAKATIPEFVVEREAALDALLAFRAALKGQLPEGTLPPSLNDFVVAAVARALAADRTLNASWRDGRVERYGRVNVGVAVAAPGGLVVPVVHDADTLSLGAIARRTRVLAAAAREGRLTPPDMAGGTFTVSNLGMMGVTRLVPIINDPQAGILGVGRAVARVFLQDGVPVERTEMALTLAGDHRVADGADGAAFLARVCELLEAPAVLALG